MPKRTDIKSICLIGAGPIVIGQACEFDYSGTQACKALRAEGYRVILINSNPATIMTDPDLADATYIEPITPAIVTRILERERPDALLPTMGGQTALNMALELSKDGVLDRLGIELIGAKREAIAKAEDRLLFREAMTRIGLETPKSQVVKNSEEAKAALRTTGLPAIIRPSFTLAGTGGGIAYNRQEFFEIVEAGINASPIGEVLVEESVLGWKEYEMEVVRDPNDNCIIVCSIENVDPMGVHTGDSITVAPALTLSDKEYQVMRNASIAVLREIGVDTGGSNVQFAVNPADGRLVVIEMNPRVSRSSALASKATGFPIAKVAAKLAVGYTLDELKNDITGTTPAAFEPTIDYVVTKIPRFNFEKFPGAEPLLGTAMKSVGEVMAIGRTFRESVQKALRSLETGLTGFDPVAPELDAASLRTMLARPTPDRLRLLADALRAGISQAECHQITRYDPWFIAEIAAIVAAEQALAEGGLPASVAGLRQLKAMGFSDQRLAKLTNRSEADIRDKRRRLGVRPVFKRIDSCAAEFASKASYFYSSYEGGLNTPVCEANPSGKKKVVILGSGPNRIGQGIEFDYCCVQACYAIKSFARGADALESIMINCNPETVSTDYDTSDRLYFEPLTAEDVLEILDREAEKGEILGVIVQFGGQTPLKLAKAIDEAGYRILGTAQDAIDISEDRERFQVLLKELDLRQPPNGLARSIEEAEGVAARIGYPLIIRPSYVLGGRAMEIVHEPAALERYMKAAVVVSGKNPVLLDHYLKNAVEVDVDVLGDGEEVYVAGIMEHIEEAGIHSGDSACALPPWSLPEPIVRELAAQAEKLARALGVRGLMNAQFAVQDGKIYVIEVNPRASRTSPFVAKATGVPLAQIATELALGRKLKDYAFARTAFVDRTADWVAVKEVVMPFARFPGVDIVLGPEMKSTGEAMGIDRDFGRAFAKAQLGAHMPMPTQGTVFISVKDADKAAAIPLALQLITLGFSVVATGGTAKTLSQAGLKVKRINKVQEGQPHIVDAMINDDIALAINTVEGKQAIADSFSIRRTTLMQKIPHFTTIAAARAAVLAIATLKQDLEEDGVAVRPLQSYFAK